MARSAVRTDSHTLIYTVHCEAISIGTVVYSRPVIPSHLPNLPLHSCLLSEFIPKLNPIHLIISSLCSCADIHWMLWFVCFFRGNNLHQKIFFELLMLFIFHIKINFSKLSPSNQTHQPIRPLQNECRVSHINNSVSSLSLSLSTKCCLKSAKPLRQQS